MRPQPRKLPASVICERRETDHFQHCIGEHEGPMTAGATGLRVVEILQAD
jgi:hypothetical protein